MLVNKKTLCIYNFEDFFLFVFSEHSSMIKKKCGDIPSLKVSAFFVCATACIVYWFSGCRWKLNSYKQ